MSNVMREALVLLATAATLGCSSPRPSTTPSQSALPAASSPGVESLAEAGPARAEAALKSADGATIEGTATFIEEPDGVRVVLEVAAAPPGMKGVHVHERGDCSDIKGKSMGPHFAPHLDHHALPSEGEARHLGDLGNINVDPSGKGRLEIKVNAASLEPNDAESFLGRSLVVHAGQDAGSATQPSGGSGDPMACGIIERS